MSSSSSNAALVTVHTGEKYAHYKQGNKYQVKAVSQNSDYPQELMVTYQALTGTKALWTRPLSDFLSHVETSTTDGQIITVPRFTLIAKKVKDSGSAPARKRARKEIEHEWVNIEDPITSYCAKSFISGDGKFKVKPVATPAAVEENDSHNSMQQ